ncbi:hypothetical protein ILUMI_26210 [Ignelater luminosus]|uniref:LITAF domain-containing protein n=1 Tax=Ignelater luminosus TaxID=2038154 RepID=A0A8K0C3Z6_IGNLU|nr:hypothetical protein ILUMI_26210 [Ignelater luminosus]
MSKSQPLKYKIRKENRSASQDIILNDTVIVSNFGPDSQVVKCPFCNNFDNTKIKSKLTLKTHFCAVVMCLSGLCLCCGCPYCTSSRKNRHHYCSKCRAYLGSYRY